MGKINPIEGVYITNLKTIKNVKGDIMHGLRSDENIFNGFGEAYLQKLNIIQSKVGSFITK